MHAHFYDTLWLKPEYCDHSEVNDAHLCFSKMHVGFAASPPAGRETGRSSSPEEADDFVLVPANIPSDHSSDGSCEKG